MDAYAEHFNGADGSLAAAIKTLSDETEQYKRRLRDFVGEIDKDFAKSVKSLEGIATTLTEGAEDLSENLEALIGRLDKKTGTGNVGIPCRRGGARGGKLLHIHDRHDGRYAVPLHHHAHDVRAEFQKRRRRVGADPASALAVVKENAAIGKDINAKIASVQTAIQEPLDALELAADQRQRLLSDLKENLKAEGINQIEIDGKNNVLRLSENSIRSIPTSSIWTQARAKTWTKSRAPFPLDSAIRRLHRRGPGTVRHP